MQNLKESNLNILFKNFYKIFGYETKEEILFNLNNLNNGLVMSCKKDITSNN